MTIAYSPSHSTLVAGINSAPEELEKGKNENLRVFEVERERTGETPDGLGELRIEERRRRGTMKTVDPDQYQVRPFSPASPRPHYFPTATDNTPSSPTAESNHLLPPLPCLSRRLHPPRHRLHKLATLPPAVSRTRRGLAQRVVQRQRRRCGDRRRQGEEGGRGGD